MTIVNITHTFFSAAAGSVQIETRLPQVLTAPAQVWAKATNITGLAAPSFTGSVYRGEFHEYFYYWEVRGAPLAPFNAPENMPPDWNNPNVMTGQEVPFFLADPGDYIIDLVVIDHNGVSAVAETQTITVIDADVYYPGAATVCFSLADDFTGKPAGAAQVTSLQALKDYINNTRTSLETRVLYHRGETYPDHDLVVTASSGANYFGAYGSASEIPELRPVFFHPGASSRDGCIQFKEVTSNGNTTFTVTGLKFRSDWDVTSETGSLENIRLLNVSQCEFANANFTFHALEFEDGNTCLGIDGNRPDDTTDNRFMVVDCSFSGWKNYGIFATASTTDFLAIVGTKIIQKVDALNGGDKNTGFMNNHGPCRFADITGVYSTMNDIFSRTGWSKLDQPCMRLATTSLPDQWTHISRSVMEGGYIVVSLEGATEAIDDLPGNHLLERNLFISTAVNNLPFVSCHRGGTTVRGNYGYTPPNLYVRANSQVRKAFTFHPDNSQGGNDSEPVAFYGNTVLAMRDPNQSNNLVYEMVGMSGFTTTVNENNLLHAPNLNVPVVDRAPMDISPTVPNVTLRYKGLRVGYRTVKFTGPTGGVANGGTLLVPYSILHQQLAPVPGSQDPVDFNGETDTDQAYWQSLAPTDVRHTLQVPDVGPLCAHMGHFTVDFSDSVNAIITNTSGVAWPESVEDMALKLHRNSKIPAMDTSFGHDGQTVPLPAPASASSSAWQSATGQFVMPTEFIDGTTHVGSINQGAV